MAKRDYYEILGLNKSSTSDEIKKPIARLQCNITLIEILVTRQRRKNSRKR